MARVKTFTNGGSLLPGDLNSIEDDYELAFSSYKHIFFADTFSVGSTGALMVQGNSNGYAGVFYFDPATVAANPRTVYLNVVAMLAVNQVAPGTNVTVGLYAVNISYGTSSNSNTYTLGSQVTGSSATFTTPAASSQGHQSSGDFAAPSAGFYCLGVKSAAGLAAGSICETTARLLARQV